MHSYLDGAPQIAAAADIAYSAGCWALVAACIGAAFFVLHRRRDP